LGGFRHARQRPIAIPSTPNSWIIPGPIPLPPGSIRVGSGRELLYSFHRNSPMPHGPLSADSQSPAVETFLLGEIPYLRCLEFQQRLLEEASERADGQIVVLMCEHPPVITIGRGGRPSQVASNSQLLRSREIEIHWTNRGGGCLLHCPGQLAIYPILPLRWHDFSLGEFLNRFQAAVAETLIELGVQIQLCPGRYGVWGRTGQIAAFGVAVRDWVTRHGAYLNVS